MGNVNGRNLGDHPSQTYADHHKPRIIKNDIELKKETFRFEPDEENPGKFLVSFTIDANVSGSVTVMFFAKEGEKSNLSATKEDRFPSSTFSFTKGLGQKFQQRCGTGIDFSALSETELLEASLTNVHHVAVKAEPAEKNNDPELKTPNSQITHVVLEKDGDEYKARVVKQILWVNGFRYELQDIYGQDGNKYERGKKCVTCLSEPQDTTVLPCRHTCICSGCAKLLKFQTNRCPVCEQPVERLLEMPSLNQ